MQVTGNAAVDVETSEPSAPPPISREQRRSRRRHSVRAHSISVKRMAKRELELGKLLYPPDPDLPRRPPTRAGCLAGGANEMRPCPFVSCEHHLYLDVSERTGAIKLNRPDLEVWEMPETCSLDVAARGSATLEEVGAIMNITRERVRQIEVKAFARIKSRDTAALREHYGDVRASTKRRLPLLDEDDEQDGERERVQTRDEIDPDEFASVELDDVG